jgi:hypothetical protein
MPDKHVDADMKWSQYIIRFVLNKEMLIQREISVYNVVRSIRNVFEDTLCLEYTSEYSDECILRVR